MSAPFPPPVAAPSNGVLIRRLLGLTWRYRLGCIKVLSIQLVLLTMGLAGLSLTGLGIDYIRQQVAPVAPLTTPAAGPKAPDPHAAVSAATPSTPAHTPGRVIDVSMLPKAWKPVEVIALLAGIILFLAICRALLNYTYVKSRIEYLISPTSAATITDDLLNLSPKSWNATLYYDDGRFTARASAAHRTTFLTRVPGQNNNDVEGKNSSLNVDASLSYKINNNVQLIFEGVNLTNEKNDQFISRARNSSVVYSVTGREYLAGVRVVF